MSKIGFLIKHSRRRYILTWSLIASAACADASGFDKRPVALVADNWCPQHCKVDGRYKGYVVEIVSEALQSEGVDFNIVYRPWLRALRQTEQGQFDGLLTPTVAGYPQFTYPRQSVGFQQYCFYVKANSSWEFNKPSDLQGKRVAHLKESGFGALADYFAANKKTIQINEFVGDDDLTTRMFKFLSADRTDVVIVTSDVYDFGIRVGKLDGAFKRAGCLASEELAVGLTKSDPARSRWIASKLDLGIATLRKSGRLKVILDKYGIPVWPAGTR